MLKLTPAASQRLKLETLLNAVRYYHLRLADELQRDAGRPEHMQALVELRDLWQHRMDACKAEELRLKEEIASLDLDQSFAAPPSEPTPPTPVEEVRLTKPKRRRKATSVEGLT